MIIFAKSLLRGNKNKKMKFSNDYTNSGKYDNYKTPNDESYSYKRSDYDSLAHEDYYVY